MKTILSFIIIIVLVALGVYIYGSDAEDRVSNVEMFRTGNETEIITEEVSYFENARGYFARPAAEAVYPGVVMIHENRGLRPEIKVMAEELAKEGYYVLAVDLLGDVVETQDEARALTLNFDQTVGTRNMQAAAEFLISQGSSRIASLGWCFGGRQSLELATSGTILDATVVYYGGGMATSTQELAPIDWPVLGIFGDEDRAIPVEMIEDFKNSLNTLGVEHEVYIYPGVGHAFANPSGTNYAPEETRDAWDKTISFLDSHLKR